jgi:CHAD domain-containing protein
LHKSYLNKHNAAEKVPVYSKTIDQLTSAEIKRFSALKNQKEIKALGLKSDMLRVEPLQIDENSLEDSIEKEQENILKLLIKSKLKVPEVHDLRKRIKSFYFLNSLLPVRKKKLKHLNEFQELLGKWHDYEVFGEELQKANKLQHLPLDEKKKLRKLKPKVFRKQEALFKKIDKSRFALVKN